MTTDELIALAAETMERAHAPYSRFPVGAALEATDGRVFTGCNVENASYPLTICAERAAVAAAVAAGATDFRRVVITTRADTPASPCGACRQVLAEFAPDMMVISASGGEVREWSLADLLPERFSGRDLSASASETTVGAGSTGTKGGS